MKALSAQVVMNRGVEDCTCVILEPTFQQKLFEKILTVFKYIEVDCRNYIFVSIFVYFCLICNEASTLSPVDPPGDERVPGRPPREGTDAGRAIGRRVWSSNNRIVLKSSRC